MTLPQGIVLASLLWLVVELIRDKRPPGALFAGIAFGYVLLDYISLKDAVKQFTNNGLLTVVVLLLLTIVLDKSRMLELLADRLVRGPYRWALVKLYAATALYSAFLNNTAVVASLLGPLKGNREHSASRLLMPMCFAASLGGIMTLVGTSTNLLVNSLLAGRQMPELRLFDLFPVGALIVVACGAVMVLLYPRLLKAQAPAEAQDHAPVRQVVEHRDLLGRAHGVVPRQHDDRRAELDARRPARHPGEELLGLEGQHRARVEHVAHILQRRRRRQGQRAQRRHARHHVWRPGRTGGRAGGEHR